MDLSVEKYLISTSIGRMIHTFYRQLRGRKILAHYISYSDLWFLSNVFPRLIGHNILPFLR
jgi:hypothetical protein